MIVGILIIVWVFVLKSLDKKRQMEDRQKAGLVSPGPASFDTLKKSLGEISERLGNVENDYQ
jgi:hypothetical protein